VNLAPPTGRLKWNFTNIFGVREARVSGTIVRCCLWDAEFGRVFVFVRHKSVFSQNYIITETTPRNNSVLYISDATRTIHFWRDISWWIPNRHHNGGAKYMWDKKCNFQQLAVFLNRYKIDAQFLWKVNGKSDAVCEIVTLPMTLSDPKYIITPKSPLYSLFGSSFIFLERLKLKPSKFVQVDHIKC